MHRAIRHLFTRYVLLYHNCPWHSLSLSCTRDPLEDKKIPGLNIDVYADNTVAQLLGGAAEIYFPTQEHIIRGTREQLDGEFDKWNGNNA